MKESQRNWGQSTFKVSEEQIQLQKLIVEVRFIPKAPQKHFDQFNILNLIYSGVLVKKNLIILSLLKEIDHKELKQLKAKVYLPSGEQKQISIDDENQVIIEKSIRGNQTTILYIRLNKDDDNSIRWQYRDQRNKTDIKNNPPLQSQQQIGDQNLCLDYLYEKVNNQNNSDRQTKGQHLKQSINKIKSYMNGMNDMFDDIKNAFTAKDYKQHYSDIESLIQQISSYSHNLLNFIEKKITFIQLKFLQQNRNSECNQVYKDSYSKQKSTGQINDENYINQQIKLRQTIYKTKSYLNDMFTYVQNVYTTIEYKQYYSDIQSLISLMLSYSHNLLHLVERKISFNKIQQLKLRSKDQNDNQNQLKQQKNKINEVQNYPIQNSKYQQSIDNSYISHDHRQQNQVTKYFLTITKNQNLPIFYKTSKVMRQYIFENTNNLIFYLAANKSKFKYVAQHFTRQQSILRIKKGQKHSKDKSFSLLVQIGDADYSNYIDQGSLAYYLWEKGLKYVIEWIISTAKGIAELEEFGIFHCDLQFRNTIKIGESFKIIDFDRAFVVRKRSSYSQNYKVFKSTKDIIKIWLKSEEQSKQSQQGFIVYMFCQTNDRQLVQKIKNQKQNGKQFLSETVDNIMRLLQNYMYKSHLDRFCALISGTNGLLCRTLVDKFKQKVSNLDEIVGSILKATNKLLEGTIKYKAFWEQMQEIQKPFLNLKLSQKEQLNNSSISLDFLLGERVQKVEQNQIEYIRNKGSDYHEKNKQIQPIKQLPQEQHKDYQIIPFKSQIIQNYKQKQAKIQIVSQSGQEQNEQIISEFRNQEKSQVQKHQSQSQLSLQSSYISHDIKEQNIVKFLLTITKNQNLPILYKTDKSMRQAIFKNTNNIIFYLATNRSKFSHIAKHFTRQSTILRTDNKDRKFQFLVEKGDQKYSNYKAQSELANYLWEIDFKYVIQWIISIAKGISELEECGIFHRDLFLRNTIKIGQIFKIIDFDLAFIVRQCSQFEGNEKAYKSTKEIIKIWVSSKQQEQHLQFDFIFYMFYCIQEQQVLKKILDVKLSDKFSKFGNLSAKVNQIMKQLQNHMRKSHLQQFVAMINGSYKSKGLLSEALIEKFKHKIGSNYNIIAAIRSAVDRLKKGVIGYNALGKQLQKIKLSLQEES